MANNQVVVYLLLNAAQYNAAMAQATGTTQKMGATAAAAGNTAASGLKAASTASTNFAQSVGKVLSTAATLAVRFAGMYVAVGALKSIVSAGIDEFVKLDTNLRNIQSITLDSDKSIDKLRGTLLSSVIAGDTFGRSASELSAGMYELVSAGYSTDDALKLVKVAAMGAAAGLSDTATVSKLLLSILQAYKLPVSEAANVMDQLFTIVDLGVIHFDQLAATMGLLIPTAASLKVPLNEMGAAIELLTRQGQAPSRVMTNLNDVLTKLLKPTVSLAAALDEIGFKSGDAAVKAVGFVEVVRRLSILANGSESTLAKWFGDVRAIRAILPLAADAGRDFTDMLAEHNAEVERGGRTLKALEEQQKSMSYQWSVLTSKLRAVVGLTIGELTPSVVNLISTLNSGIETLVNIVGAITGSADAMLILKGVVVAFIAVSVLPRLVALLNSWAMSMLTSSVGTRLLTAASGDLAGAFLGLGAAIQKIAIVALITALYVAFTKLADISPISGTIDGMRKSLEELDKTLQSGKEAVGKGLMSKEAYGIFADREVVESVVGNIDRITKGLDALNHLTLTDELGKFFNDAKQGFLWLTGGFLGAADVRSNFQKLRDEWTQTFGESLAKLGDNKDAVKRLEQSVRELVAAKQAELKTTIDQLGHQKNLSDEDIKRVGSQKAIVQMLIEADAAAVAQYQAILKTEAAHRKAAIAAKETTEAIQTANDRVEAMAKNATAWAGNLKVVEETIKAIGGLMTPQKAANEANIASLELQIKEYESLHKVSKESIESEIDGLDKAKNARKLANDTMDAGIKAQERNLDRQKAALDMYDKAIAKLEKQKDSFKTPANDKLRDLNEQMRLLKDQQQIMEDSKQNTSGIKRQIEDLQKRINLETLSADKETITKRKADESIDGQIKKQKELKEKAELIVKAEEDRIKKLKEQYDLAKENARLEDDKAAARIQDLKDQKTFQDPVLQNMKDQLEKAKEIEGLEAARVKHLQAQATAAAMQNLSSQGMTLELNEQKFILAAIPAVIAGNVQAVEELANKFGISNDRAQELLGKALSLSGTNATPKFDANAPKPLADSTENVYQKMLTVNRTPVKVQVDNSGLESTMRGLQEIARTLAKGFRTVIHWSKDKLPGNALGGIYSKHMITEIAEGDNPEVVLPLTNPVRAKQLLSQISPNILGDIMPRFASALGTGSGGSAGGGGLARIAHGGTGRNGDVKLADSLNLTAPSADELLRQLHSQVDDLGGQLRMREARRGAPLNGRLM